jgi:SAM-dependent methyltransferase
MSAGPLAASPPWNLVADGYERTLRPYLEAFSRSGLARVPFDRRSRVIDIACGPGTTALLLAPSVEQVTCVDFAESMLDELRRNAGAAEAGNLEIVLADGQALPFRDASFDLAVSMFGLMFFPDRRKGFAELARVLRPGGHALVSSWAPVSRSPLALAMFEALRPEGQPPSEPGPPTGLEDPSVFKSEMADAGLIDIRIEPVAHALFVEDVGEFWRDTVSGTAPIALWQSSLPAADWAPIEKLALKRLQASLGSRLPVELSSTAWIATARKP